ncbi:hypothetical protein C7410_1169 [Paraburkholderia silvatlantica]|uniref:FlxA-like protein n=1 Tax=Paraburkholderia silvatlantica TaxID=321895 RepID=A0A2V4UJM9_9BURK|nr:hypothetical protein [Paraburkholderia silvatlantica]PYE20471.1 hypothetical protein C7410_1169 [Paraburkholderia silvatlantica]
MNMQVNANITPQVPQTGTVASSTDTGSSSTTTDSTGAGSAASSGGANASASTRSAAGVLSGASTNSVAIQQLKALINSLRAQLAKTQEAIAHERVLASQDASGVAASTATSLSGQVATIESALQTATAELAQLMLASGNTTGLVNDTV